MSLFTRIFGDSPTKIVLNSILIAFLLYLFWRFILRPVATVIVNIRSIFREEALGVLEIIPPRQSELDPLNTQNLIAVLQRQLGKRQRLSLEIVGTKKTGIRYQVVAPKQHVPSLQKHFASYLPELKFKQPKGSLASQSKARVFSIRQARHFAFPLKQRDELNKTDPVSFIAGSLTRLEDNEEITLQLVVGNFASQKGERIRNQLIRNGRTLIDGKFRYYLLVYAWIWIPALIAGLLSRSWQWSVFIVLVFGIASLFTERKEKELTTLEEKLFGEVAAKLEQHLFQTDIRLSVYSPNRPNALVSDFVSSLETLHAVGLQGLVLQRRSLGKWWQSYISRLFTRRLSSVMPFNTSVLSASELASLFHFPYGTIKTAGMVRSHSRTLPAPLSLKDDPDFDVVIGVNKHHSVETPIGLTKAERERHMFVVGGTGSGKTTMLKYQIVQDIKNGKGLAVVDPHGDLAEELLEYIPKERKDDLIYLNPDDLDHPVGVNLLELPEGLSGNDLLREKDRVTESVISVMRKIFSEDDSGGHRIEYVLRNTIQTALTMDKPTLFTIFRLLNDGKYAKDAIKNLEDEDLKAFWRNELGKAGSMQKVKMAAGITSKIGRFLFSASARAMLEQEKSTINFDEILDGKILICNFSKGRLGEDTSMLFGVTILAKLQLAALKRSERKQADRTTFYLYVDEFQNFATLSFTQMLSEARKYKVFLTMAEQSTQQQDDQKMVNIILANVGTVVAFRTGSPKDEELLLPLFEPYIEKGEIANLPAYNFYCRIMGIKASEPVSGHTIVF